MQADNPGRVRAIPWQWSPEGPFSTLIIYETLLPPRFIGERGGGGEGELVLRARSVGQREGVGETPRVGGCGWASWPCHRVPGTVEPGSESRWSGTCEVRGAW